MPYASLNNINSLLHLNLANYADDPALSFLASRVDSAINEYCGVDFDYGNSVELYTIHTNLIALRKLPIDVINSVTIDGELITSDYYQKLSKGILLTTGAFKKAESLIEIDYSGGYDPIPVVIDHAATLQLAYEYQRHGHIGATSVSNDGGSTQYPELKLLRGTKSLLNRFRNGYAKCPVG